VHDSVARREACGAARNALASMCASLNVPKPRLVFPIDDSVPMDEFRVRLDAKVRKLTQLINIAKHKSDAVADVRSLAVRLSKLGIRVDVDEDAVTRCTTTFEVDTVIAGAKHAMRGSVLPQIDEKMFDDAVVHARAIDPSMTLLDLAPNVYARLLSIRKASLADMLAFAEDAKRSAMHAAQLMHTRLRLKRFRERVMRMTGMTSECLSSHFRQFSSPTEAELANVDRTVAEIHALATSRKCPMCPGNRAFSPEGLAAHAKAKHS